MNLLKDKIKIRFVFYGAFFFIFSILNSQNSYFQQEVNYKINVTLNDVKHSLKGFEEITYINNSPQTLDFIYFHLWPNAYKNNATALCKQLESQGKTNLFFSKEEDRGWIDSLNFKVNGQTVRMVYDSLNPDICKIYLKQKLRPLDSLIISTPFIVKIPDAKFSRLGHTGEAYFITQWYPKPAVFDNEGWHAMPYLDQGEFYSEFGSFDVSITLPDNYVLAATGDRIDAEQEEEFLNNRVKQTLKFIESNTRIKDGMSFPLSSSKFKTVRFKQYRVHDFAWFADKRFYALHDQIQLPTSKRTIDTWAFFTDKNFNLWKNAIDYINKSSLFYSSLVGDYPYNHVTAIDGTIMAGGGMEYPEITVIGDMGSAFDLDVTIAHEVGHNWFYGILGSNERRFPFMDEGINSFYEMRYVRQKYPNKKLTEYLGRDSSFKLLRLNKTPIWKEKELSYLMSQGSNLSQAIDLASDDFSRFNYGAIVYGKTPVAFDFLMDYLGESHFDELMKSYYEHFKFKHPQPNDLMHIFDTVSHFNLAWFNEQFIQSNHSFDYKIKRVRGKALTGFELSIKNKTKHAIPFNVSAFKDKQLVAKVWYDGFEKERLVKFPPLEADYFKIDVDEKIPELNRRNNFSRTKGLFRKAKPLELSFITALENPNKNQLHYLPVLGANVYDGSLLGLALHNYGFYGKKFDYLLAPFYGFNSKQFGGFSQLDYNIYTNHLFSQITIGNKIKTFNYDLYKPIFMGNAKPNQLFRFFKIENYLIFNFKKPRANSTINKFIKLSNNNIFVEKDNNQFSFLSSSINSYTLSKVQDFYYVNQFEYQLQNKRGIDPYALQANVQQASNMAKMWVQFNYQLSLNTKSFFELRCFVGSFLFGTVNSKAPYAFRADGYNGNDDYLFDYNYVGRNERTGVGFNQFIERDGALKVWTPLGKSSTWLASINLKSPRLGILPIKLYVEVLTCDKQYLLKDQFLWDVGVNLQLVKNLVEVYFPVLYDNDIKKTLELNNIYGVNRIRFTFNIHKLVPKKFIQSAFL